MALLFHAYRSNIIFILALIFGIVLPQCSQICRILILPALTVIITITLLRFPRGFFRNPGSLFYSSIRGNIMNYLVLGNFIILSGVFLIQKQELWVGMVLVAAMPLSLEIIIMGDLLHIERNYVFTSVAGTYLGALLIVPLVGFGFLKYMNLNYWNIIVMILCLIILPLLFSRIAVDKDWDETINKHDDMIMDYSLFVVFYAITANCRNFLLNWSADLIIITCIAFASTFLFYFSARRIGSYFRLPENRINSFILPATMKECGLAGGIALTVFSPEVAIPSLIFAIFTYIYMHWLKFRFRRIAGSDNNQKK
jgi:hypothetical protein